eukprot:scaffold912_cov422-Prasinococcus_capsulatus_cf.AAC.2
MRPLHFAGAQPCRTCHPPTTCTSPTPGDRPEAIQLHLSPSRTLCGGIDVVAERWIGSYAHESAPGQWTHTTEG